MLFHICYPSRKIDSDCVEETKPMFHIIFIYIQIQLLSITRAGTFVGAFKKQACVLVASSFTASNVQDEECFQRNVPIADQLHS